MATSISVEALSSLLSHLLDHSSTLSLCSEACIYHSSVFHRKHQFSHRRR